MKEQQTPIEGGFMTREMLQSQPTEMLLVLLPEYWQIFKDAGTWNIGHMDTPAHNFKHPTMCDHNPRGYLIEFLLQHPYTGEEIEVQRFLFLLSKEGELPCQFSRVLIDTLNQANQNQTTSPDALPATGYTGENFRQREKSKRRVETVLRKIQRLTPLERAALQERLPGGLPTISNPQLSEA